MSAFAPRKRWLFAERKATIRLPPQRSRIDDKPFFEKRNATTDAWRQREKERRGTILGELFDPHAEVLIHEHWRPHWAQAGAVVFITFRTADSIPHEVVERWNREKRDWLAAREYDVARDLSKTVARLSGKDLSDFRRHFDRCREVFLDTCQGRCLLRRPELAKIVADALLHFDGQRYRMGDFVIMPNHVHLLAAFDSAAALKEQCDSWLHYTAFRINQALGERNKFWQQEPFDHLVRSPEQYEYLREYIAENPQKARLQPGEFYYRRFGG